MNFHHIFQPCFFVVSAWIHDDQIWPYVENREKYTKYKSAQRPSRAFLDAVEKADEILQFIPKDKVDWFFCVVVLNS
jgi:hypothetical protein